MSADLRVTAERTSRYWRAPMWGSPRIYSRGKTFSQRCADGQFYSASRLSARIARVGLRGMLAMGLGSCQQPLLDELGSELRPWIRSLLPEADREVFAIGRAGASGKAVLVSVSPRGEALAFTKAAWEVPTMALLKREVDLLPLAADEGLGPAPIGVYEGQTVFALMSEALPGREPGLRDPVPAALLQRAAGRSISLPHDRHPAVLACAEQWPEFAPRLHALLSGIEYDVGLVHGDAAPWNTRVASGVAKMFDWEYGRCDGLPATDVAHWVLQTRHLIERSGPARACDTAAAVLARGVGLTAQQAKGVCALTTLDVCHRLRIEEKRLEAAWWESCARYALAEAPA